MAKISPQERLEKMLDEHPELRAIYEHLKDTLDDCPQSERMDLAVAMLCEFEEWARHIKGRLKESSKKAK